MYNKKYNIKELVKKQKTFKIINPMPFSEIYRQITFLSLPFYYFIQNYLSPNSPSHEQIQNQDSRKTTSSLLKNLIFLIFMGQGQVSKTIGCVTLLYAGVQLWAPLKLRKVRCFDNLVLFYRQLHRQKSNIVTLYRGLQINQGVSCHQLGLILLLMAVLTCEDLKCYQLDVFVILKKRSCQMDLQHSTQAFSFDQDEEPLPGKKAQYYEKFLNDDSEFLLQMDIESSSQKVQEGLKSMSEENYTLDEINLEVKPIRITLVNGKERQSYGCRCAKTGCKKEYCSCLKNKVKCGISCGCLGCENHRFVKHIACNFQDYWMHSLAYEFGK